MGTTPDFAIGQRALLVRTGAGLVMWDCISFIDEAAIELVRALGGLRAIAISHPHYYSSMVEWSRAFGGVPVLPARRRPAVGDAARSGDRLLGRGDRGARPRADPDPVRRTFRGRHGPALGGQGAGDKGALLSGDIVQVGLDRKHVSFMRSYPNLIPLDAASVQRIARVLEPWPFDPIYGAWFERIIPSGGKQAVAQSVRRYLSYISAPPR